MASRKLTSYGILAAGKLVKILSTCGEAGETYQIVIDVVANLTRLNAKVLEGLCSLINNLVVELTLNLISRANGPPKNLVEQSSHGLQDGLGDVNVSPLLEDFPVNQLRDFSCRVVLGAVELKGLGYGVVIVEDLLQSLANIDNLNWR